MNPSPAKSKPERERNERQDWAIVLVILLIGLCCVAGAGQYALRLAPNWQVDTDMESNLDLNSQILTGKPQEFFEPLDPAILTQPGWVNGNVFLTPGAVVSFPVGTPLPASNTTNTAIPTALSTTPVTTNTVAVITSPTNTLVWIPLPATSTSRPNPGATVTNTSPASAPDADLWILKTSTTNTYTAGSTLSYAVTVGNAGPDAISGVVVRDNLPAQIASWTWTCTTPGVNGCDGAPLNNTNFSDTVNLPNGASIEYTVNVTTSGGGDLANTASVTAAGYTETVPSNNQDDHTHTLTVAIPSADLQITMTDGTTNYTPGVPGTYTIQVFNNGPNAISSATITDNFILPISGFGPGGGCTTTGSATCGWSGSGNINDTVNLPAGSTITYTVPVTTDSWYLMNLENTASVSAVGYTEAAPGNETATDTDTLVIAPPGSIGSSPDCSVTWPCTTELPAGSSLILNTSITVPGVAGPDLIYYERPNGGNIRMDWVILQISDGTNTYTILDWGNQGGGGADTNTNINVNVIGGTEDDDRVISQNNLYPYPGTGVEIELDGIGIPNGTYTYIRIIVPLLDPTGNGCGIDAIEVLSP